MEASHETLTDGISRNIIAEIVGSDNPEQVVSVTSSACKTSAVLLVLQLGIGMSFDATNVATKCNVGARSPLFVQFSLKGPYSVYVYVGQVVMFGGHIDSWDVGVGAMDDGGGVMITRQVGDVLCLGKY